MTTTILTPLIETHGSLLALSKHLLGEEWTPAAYDTIRRQVAAGKLTRWVAATVAKELEAEELRVKVAKLEAERLVARNKKNRRYLFP